jgi:hypothetical protein
MPRHTKECRKKWVIKTYGFYYCPVHDSLIDWEAEFAESMKIIFRNRGKTCDDCKHFNGHFSCPAFPEGIPDPYWSGMEIHTKSNKYMQENSIVFQPKTKRPPKSKCPTKTKCPKCGNKKDVIPIIFGFPMQKTMDKAERGEVKLGGCCIGNNDPQWYCKSCKKKFGKN